jgi:nucleoside 2-deoxyribosyltransferase
MNIYLAGPWARRDECRAARDWIHTHTQHRVVARWLDHVITGAPDEQQVEAMNDIYDMLDSEALVVLNLEKSEGKSFEQGFMFAHLRPIVVVGTQTHVFQYLPEITIVPTVKAAMDWLTTSSFRSRPPT